MTKHDLPYMTINLQPHFLLEMRAAKLQLHIFVIKTSSNLMLENIKILYS